LTLGATALRTLIGAVAAAPKQIRIPPSNPYWTVLTAQNAKALSYGQQVGTCTFLPSTSCTGVRLPAQSLAGAFAPFGDFAGADFAGSSLAGAFIPHTNFRGTDLSGVSLVGTTPAYADFRART
jgi:uncharacterized protein YjbI with pentapeptide repeats